MDLNRIGAYLTIVNMPHSVAYSVCVFAYFQFNNMYVYTLCNYVNIHCICESINV